ncbi:VOC family protein [Microbulbifer sp. THAF38]|uniref:VOC family protein n=1 Tax=unclassified Microbulbifer TaxID=2619833 RepID=UPI001267C6ED|nr:VOC family protein [Microbulbifer sp. THAF38]QFT54297.1 Glyoxalase-like domain protein [Microbulbifer sp. THAF38]
MKAIGRLVILVKDYEEAIVFYRDKLGFEVFVDSETPPLRFVHLRLPQQKDMGIWLLQASSNAQLEQVGRQTAGQPCAVIYTEDFENEYQRLRGNGVKFTKPRLSDSSAEFAHFEDLYGNEFVLVHLKAEVVD